MENNEEEQVSMQVPQKCKLLINMHGNTNELYLYSRWWQKITSER